MENDADKNENRLVTVCSACLCACCWQGEFYCDDYQQAGTKEMPVSELRKLKLEHPGYWDGRPRTSRFNAHLGDDENAQG